MALWFDLLKTPMAAPETAELRRDRKMWQLLCLLSAAAVFQIGPLVYLFGKPAAVVVALLLGATLMKTVFYLLRKQKADNAYLDAVTEDVA